MQIQQYFFHINFYLLKSKELIMCTLANANQLPNKSPLNPILLGQQVSSGMASKARQTIDIDSLLLEGLQEPYRGLPADKVLRHAGQNFKDIMS